MHAHLLQTDIAWEDRPANHRRVAAMLDALRPARGDLVVLPEMFDTGFSFRLDVTADRDGSTLAFLREAGARHAVTLQGARTVIGPDGKGRNRASVIGPDGSILCEYDKIHPFSFGRESEFFSGGDDVRTYPWAAGPAPETRTTVCPAICYDLRFPELFRRGVIHGGAEVLALGANWPLPRALHRTVLAQARAIENQAYVLCVNRAGSDPHLRYAGGTAAFGPQGDPLGQLDEDEGVLSVAIDLPALRAWRDRFPAVRDARLA
ncbi:MAG: carbon-nitrogen family hydrolase [Phycisphaerae bacterium]|nr:carbon-nitrogen family hydrolase [Phycisphaerae bacterium]